jgi:hypothetical protein
MKTEIRAVKRAVAHVRRVRLQMCVRSSLLVVVRGPLRSQHLAFLASKVLLLRKLKILTSLKSWRQALLTL